MSQKKSSQIPLRFNKDIPPVFQIDHLECSYVPGQVVLKASDVNIPRNYVTILLGPSGAGKSTLLESLGLMSQTINPDITRIKFYPEPGQQGFPFEQLWDDKSRALLNKVRQDYFSFIFQSTNLMSNFNAIENVTLTGLIQSQPLPLATYKAINTTVEDLGIKSMEYEKLPSAFSGGERQRIAFSRAAIPEFSVLFGDEPTGNLDHFNSNKLMEFIHNFIREHKNKSALIVSHNIDLALDFADRIVILTKNFENSDSTSIILEEFILDKEVIDWDANPETKKRIKKEIELLLNNDTSHFIELLSRVKRNGCSEKTYLELKDNIIDWALLSDENKKPGPEEIKKFRNLITDLSFKEIQVGREEEEIINKLIKQFFEPDPVDNKEIITRINEQIHASDKELGKDVKELFKNAGIEKKPDASKKNPLKKLLLPVKFILWLAIFLVPAINFVFEKIIYGLSFIFIKPFTRKNDVTSTNNNQKKKKWFRPNRWITRGFVTTCLNVDGLMSRFEGNKKGKTTIQFDNHNEAELIKTFDINTHEVLDTPQPFKELFYKRESEKLLGNKNKNLWLILLILFLTFLAIGFSSGSLEYLEMKMQDPFIRSVSAKISGSRDVTTKAFKLIDTINMNQVLREKFKIDTIVFFNTRTFHLRGDQKNSPKYGLDGRTVDIKDPLFSIILDRKINEAVGHSFLNEQDYSLIITREALQKLGCSENPAFIFKEVDIDDSLKIQVPIPIGAIVKSLPGSRTDYIMSPPFYLHLSELGDKFLFDAEKMVFYSLIAMDSVYLQEFTQVLNTFFLAKPNGLVINAEPNIEKMPYSYKNVYRIIVAFEDYSSLTLTDLKKLFDTLKNDQAMKAFMNKAGIVETDFVQSFYPNFTSTRIQKKYDVSFNFEDLAEVEDFAEYIKANAEIKLEMSNIERMKNYNFVTKLTMLISVLLIFFSVLMITLFLSNILRTHLNSIKMNIGTFKAFGIDIGHIYQRMMFMYILVPLVVALVFCWAVGTSWALYYLMELLTKFDIEKYKYFNLFNYWTLGSIVVLLVVNYYTFSKIIRNIFNQTPGDLIYDRSNKA
jgi:lipoprotein-releasing system ATP-binding protein